MRKEERGDSLVFIVKFAAKRSRTDVSTTHQTVDKRDGKSELNLFDNHKS